MDTSSEHIFLYLHSGIVFFRSMQWENEENELREVRIFISSPGDVSDERDGAKDVVEEMQKEFAGRLKPIAVRWESLPLLATTSFQQGIDLVLAEGGIDIAVFILWSRIGSPPGDAILKKDGTEYRSGTEREWDLMLRANEQSGGKRPLILLYTRNDDQSWSAGMRNCTAQEVTELGQQKKDVESFLEEVSKNPETGANIRAHHVYDIPTSFKRKLRIHLQQLLHSIAGDKLIKPLWEVDRDGSPFLGLDAFEVKNAPVFFGREDEIIAIREILRKQAKLGRPFVLITGASGSGKSSLARAGVLPTVAAYETDRDVFRWRIVILKPGDGPDLLLTLATAIAIDLVFQDDPNRPESIGKFASDLARDLASDPEQACRRCIIPALAAVASKAILSKNQVLEDAGLKAQNGVAADGSQKPHRFLILVDQLEELFTDPRFADEEKPKAFIRALRMMVSGKNRCAWAVATVRSDFYAHCQQISDLVELKAGGGQYDLLPPGVTALRRLILQPAMLAGLRFEDRVRDSSSGVGTESLADVILHDASMHHELLPLLEYLLQQLFNARTKEGVLTFEAYRALGGVEGSLARCADDAIKDLRNEDAGLDEKLDLLLASLVTISGDDGKSFVRRRIPRKELDEKTSPKLVASLIRARLLTSSGERNVEGREWDGEASPEAAPGPTGARAVGIIESQNGESEAKDDGIVTVAHEALFRVWAPAIAWLKDNEEFVRVRARVAERMNQWRGSASDAGGNGESVQGDFSFLLQEGRELSDASKYFTKYRSGFDKNECAFISMSLEANEEKHWRASIAAGDETKCIAAWNALAAEYVSMRDRVVLELIESGTAMERRNLAFLLGALCRHPLTEKLAELVSKDDDGAVRRAAAYSIARIDDVRIYKEIESHEDSESIGALARLLVAADMQIKAPDFDNWYRTLPRRLRERIRLKSWFLRFVMALPVFIAVPVPAVFLALISAMAFKAFPGWINYAYAQATPSPMMSMFHGATAAILIGGASSFGLTLYRLVFGREHVQGNYLKPFRAVFTGMLFGFAGGVLCDAVIAGVFVLDGLQTIGWIPQEATEKPPFPDFFHMLFFENMCGWPFALNGAAVGIGMAMITNRMRSLPAWEDFLQAHSRKTLTTFKEAWEVLGGLIRLSFPYSWPLLLALLLSTLLGLAALKSARVGNMLPSDLRWPAVLLGGMVRAKSEDRPEQWSSQERQSLENDLTRETRAEGRSLTEEEVKKVRKKAFADLAKKELYRWKVSTFGRATGIGFDALTKAIGAFFAVVGMGFGIVILRSGINIEPRKKVG